MCVWLSGRLWGLMLVERNYKGLISSVVTLGAHFTIHTIRSRCGCVNGPWLKYVGLTPVKGRQYSVIHCNRLGRYYLIQSLLSILQTRIYLQMESLEEIYSRSYPSHFTFDMLRSWDCTIRQNVIFGLVLQQLAGLSSISFGLTAAQHQTSTF